MQYSRLRAASAKALGCEHVFAVSEKGSPKVGGALIRTGAVVLSMVGSPSTSPRAGTGMTHCLVGLAGVPKAVRAPQAMEGTLRVWIHLFSLLE